MNAFPRFKQSIRSGFSELFCGTDYFQFCLISERKRGEKRRQHESRRISFTSKQVGRFYL